MDTCPQQSLLGTAGPAGRRAQHCPEPVWRRRGLWPAGTNAPEVDHDRTCPARRPSPAPRRSGSTGTTPRRGGHAPGHLREASEESGHDVHSPSGEAALGQDEVMQEDGNVLAVVAGDRGLDGAGSHPPRPVLPVPTGFQGQFR